MAENFFGLTDTGKLRDNNEDAFIAEQLGAQGYVVGCVIDGVGGYEGGEIAAAIARDAILREFKGEVTDVVASMKEAFQTANHRIFEEKSQVSNYQKMACVLTLAVADIQNNQFYYAHLGDTRLYLLRDHSLVKLTKDHSFVGFLEDSGRLSEQAAMAHPKRNEINRALGFGRPELSADYVETGNSPFLPGDMLLICSDGLTDLVNKHEIISILTNKSVLPEKAGQLIQAANNAGGKDNITVVLVQNNNKPITSKATRPAKAASASAKQAVPEKEEVKENVPVTVPATSLPKESNYKLLAIILAAVCFTLLVVLLAIYNRGSEKKEDKTDSSPEQKNHITTGEDSLILMDTTKIVR